MFDRFKKALKPAKTEPVLLSDVNAAQPDPEKEQQVKVAVGRLVSSLLELERHSYEVRKELSTLTLQAVNRVKK